MSNDLDPTTTAISRNQADGTLIAAYRFQTEPEIDRLLATNTAAAGIWRATAMADRVACYRRLAATLRGRSDVLARLITAEMGKPSRGPSTVGPIAAASRSRSGLAC